MSRINDAMGGDKGTQGAGGATEQLRDKASQVAGNLREAGAQVQDAAREQYEHLRETAGEYFEEGREKARQWQHDLEDYVQEQPVKALLIAAGVGLFLGVVWKRH